MVSDALRFVLFPLFVPGDRPDRFERAITSGADAVILDLEDSVPGSRKQEARDSISAKAGLFEREDCLVFVRINGAGSSSHSDDIRMVSGLPVAGVVLPKAEAAESVRAVSEALGAEKAIVALIETAAGVANARAIAGVVARLAFGSIDYAGDIGCAHSREALLHARSELVLASRLAGLPGPIDGITASFQDAGAVEADAAHAASLGFTGKLLIHPAQIEPTARGFAPSAREIAWARSVLSSTKDGGASGVEGAMVDLAVRLRAEQIERRAARLSADRS
jgi:citrate lyase subunit beta/citryl-CoA lyase